MTKPRIGVTTRNSTSQKYRIPMIASPRSYCEALVKAEALPVLIPVNLPGEWVDEALAGLDGLVLSGGGDMETSLFGGEDHTAVDGVDPERDEFEIRLARLAAERGIPFLGICRGIQVVNVAHGGTLYTHIADQLDGAVSHTFFPGYPWDHPAHSVAVEAGSRLAQITGKSELSVNSLHHQGIDALAPGLEATAFAPDGLVEALELPGHPFGLAVQWHPEWLVDDEGMQALFRAFAAACRKD